MIEAGALRRLQRMAHPRALPHRQRPRAPQIVCGNRAGALTILLDQEGRWGAPEELPGEERPHWIARSLADVQAVLSERVELLPPPRPPQPLDD